MQVISLGFSYSVRSARFQLTFANRVDPGEALLTGSTLFLNTHKCTFVEGNVKGSCEILVAILVKSLKILEHALH